MSADGDFYREHGYVLVRSVFDEHEVEEMRGAIDRILETRRRDRARHGATRGRASTSRSSSRASTT